jgi:hypothetical protein
VREQMKNPQTRQITEALIDGHQFHAALYAYGGIWCNRKLEICSLGASVRFVVTRL